MTDERFELYSDDYFVGAYDNVKQEKINVLKSIDLLNSLVEENEQLRRYVYHCPQICNKILAYLRKCEIEDVKAVSDAMNDDKYFDEEIDTLRSWE